ncbi:hypothetical protein D3C80_1650030 [compost metagenome]
MAPGVRFGVGRVIAFTAASASMLPSCACSSDCACLKPIGWKRMRSPGFTWPTFHSSALAMVTGQTKPPRLGPSRVRITGKSPVKLIEPMAYSQSCTLEGCSPASPPSCRAQPGFGPDRRTPSRLEL